MRKVFLIFLSAFIAVAAGGYCIAWFAQAWQIKNSIEQAAAQINAQHNSLTYDALETSGFPSDIYVSIVNPHFSGRIDPALKTLLAETHPNQPNLASSLPEWDEDVMLNGRIIVGVNALSNHYSLRVSGDWKRASTIGGQKTSIASQSSGDTACTLQMERSGAIFSALWDFQALAGNGKDFLHDLRLLDCSGPSTVISDAASHATLISNGPWRFYVINTPKEGRQQARFYVKVTDVEVTPQGDAMMTLQRNAFNPNMYPIKYSPFGKQNMEIDFSYAGPSDWKAGGGAPFNIALNTFKIDNQLYTSNAAFSLNSDAAGAGRTARMIFKGEENFSEPYDSFVQEMIHGFVGQLYAAKGQQIPPLEPWLQKYTPDQMYAIFASALPNFHSLGRLAQSLDVSYQGSPDLSSGDITLSDLELSASAYGIKGNGSVKRMAGQPLPEGHVVLTCNNCARLVDDIVAYVTRLKNAVSYFQTPEQLAADAPINPKLADGINDFLKALAAPVKDAEPDKNSFTYVLASDTTAGVSVNGRRLPDIFAMYNEYVSPMLKAQPNVPNTAPASAVSPTAIAPAR